MHDRSRANQRSHSSLDTGSLAEMGLLRHSPQRMGGLEQRQWDVDIFLQDCALSGNISGMQRRLNDFLQSIDDQITVNDAVIRSLRSGSDLTRKRPAMVNVPHILMIVDCTEEVVDDSQQALIIEKRADEVMLNVGAFWIKGSVHVPPDGDISNYIRSGAGAFFPVTDVRISGHDRHNGRTVLVNRSHLRCILL